MIHDIVYRVILVGYWSEEYPEFVFVSATAAKCTHTEAMIWAVIEVGSLKKDCVRYVLNIYTHLVFSVILNQVFIYKH